MKFVRKLLFISLYNHCYKLNIMIFFSFSAGYYILFISLSDNYILTCTQVLDHIKFGTIFIRHQWGLIVSFFFFKLKFSMFIKT